MNIDTLTKMAAKWPSPIVARAEVGLFTGGGIKPKTLANADSKKEGPKERFIMGRRVCYPVPALVEWLSLNIKEVSNGAN